MSAPMQQIRPQPGPQERFLSSPADVVFYGGGAGGGKTFAELLEPLRHIHNAKFGAVIFRRTFSQIKNEGGLWDEAMELYPALGGVPNVSDTFFQFRSGMAVSFAHLQHEKDLLGYQGAQIPLIQFDEITHFTRKMFFYMLSRNRSGSGVPGYIRGTCNPAPPDDPVGGWVYRDFVHWYIDEDGFPIPERAGVIRYFITLQNRVIWGASAEELIRKYPKAKPKSFTFIPATVFDNKILLEQDPGYVANLEAMTYVERERLLRGNWLVRETAGNVLNRTWFEIVKASAPRRRAVRWWDRAATPKTANNNPDATAGMLLSQGADGYWYIEDVIKLWGRSKEVEDTIMRVASQDGHGVEIGLFQDPGQAGKGEADQMVRKLAGYSVTVKLSPKKAKGDASGKVTAAKPVSAQAERGNIKMVAGDWNEETLSIFDAFPDGGHDDEVDTLTGAYNHMAGSASLSEAYDGL